MLTAEQRAIVQSTVPLLEAGGEALITHFYQRLLGENPEVSALFNSTHQQSGAQPRALAFSVLMYAKHIDRLENLGQLPAQIINKHVSLQVQPEHYPVVGRYLLSSIREVLGAEIATDAVIAAWAAAYQQLADILIGAEAQAYERNASVPGGWRGARAFRVARKQLESSEITSFHLAPVDGGAVMDHLPGQFIGLRIVVDGKEQRRNYSLSALADGRELRISVKREAHGVVSRHLHDAVQVGDVLDIFPPSGQFTLADSDRPLVLISAGVGVTPMLAMLASALGTPRPVVFIHCARTPAVQGFRAQLDALALKHPQLQCHYCYDAGEGIAARRIGAELLADWLPQSRDVDAYFCGPQPFMAAVLHALRALGVPAAQTHYEFFGPSQALQ